jgi:hypothetical protein
MPSVIASFKEEMLACISLVFDCPSKSQLTNFAGIYGIPPVGGYYWWAVTNKSGYVEKETEARQAILKEVKG